MTNSNQRLSNEQVIIINILNTMYNDNRQTIININETLNNLISNNNNIRDFLLQFFYSNNINNNFLSQYDINTFLQPLPERDTYYFRDRLRDLNNNITSSSNLPSSNLPSSNIPSSNIPLNNLPSNNVHSNNHNNLRQQERRSRDNLLYINNRPYIIDTITEYTIPTTSRNSLNNTRYNNNILTQLLQSFFQPIEVYPTQSQIETATRVTRYGDIIQPINTQCPITMENFNDNDMVTVIRPCSHIFHTDNLMNWFRSNSRCPVCRYDIREYNLNASTEFFNNPTNPISTTNTTNSTNPTNTTNTTNSTNPINTTNPTNLTNPTNTTNSINRNRININDINDINSQLNNILNEVLISGRTLISTDSSGNIMLF